MSLSVGDSGRDAARVKGEVVSRSAERKRGHPVGRRPRAERVGN